MKNCLIMITSLYPFKSYLPFVDLEMPVLESRFDKIITFAIDSDKNSERKSDIICKAECFNATTGKNSVEKVTDLGLGMLNVFSKSELYKKDRDEIGYSLSKKVFFEYFCARARRKYEVCKKVLEQYDFSDFDSVTVYSYWFFVAALVGSMIKDDLSKVCKDVRFVSRAHGYDVYEDRSRVSYLPLRRYLLENLDGLYVCSQDGANYIRRRYPEFSDKIKYSYLGTFDCGLSQANDEEFHIVSCSQASNIKRLDRFVGSLALLEDFSEKPIRWTHIGDGPVLKKTKELAQSRLTNVKVEFLGKIKNDEVKSYYKNNSVNLFLNLSSKEGLPVSIMEAISFGIPVVATNVGGTREVVKDGFNGRLLSVDFKDEEVADIIKEMCLSDKTELQTMRNNARAFWQGHFNAEENYKAFADELTGKEFTKV